MRKLYAALSVCLLILFGCVNVFSQGLSNKGKEFWVGYGHHQFMEDGTNTQEMTLYLATGDSAAVVTVQIDSSSFAPQYYWTRTYTIPANTAISIEDPMPAGVTVTKSPATIPTISPIPKGLAGRDAGFNATLFSCPMPACGGSEGLFRQKGIHISSTAPIVAYSHIYGSVSSGATMLIPVTTWGYNYVSVNSNQNNATNAFSWMYVVANYDNTVVEIVPSVPLRSGKPASVPFTVTINKGQIYQIAGAMIGVDAGYQLTGTTVRSIDNGTGQRYPVGVFSGSSRTGGEPPCSAGGRDNDMQQVFPQESWGKQYLTAPFSNSSSPLSLMQCVYKIMVIDTSTIVKINGVRKTGLIINKYYQYVSSTADYITADKPIMVAQYMGGGCVSGDGDPEMIYLSPLAQAINKTRFYRSNHEAINTNYLTLIIPTGGVPSLKIDGQFFANIPSSDKYSYPHPNKPDYTVIIKKWAAARAQSFVESFIPFTGITYGEGGAESYGYNVGAYFDSLGSTGAGYNTLAGYLFLDKNSNGMKDSSEPYFNNANINITRPNNDTFATVTSSGSFSLFADTGVYVTTVDPYIHYYNIVPASHTSNFRAAYHQSDSVAFALQRQSKIRDLGVNIIGSMALSSHNSAQYTIFYQNLGTDTANGVIKFIKNQKYSYYYSLPDTSQKKGDTIFWNYSGLKPGEQKSIYLIMQLNSVVSIGDSIRSSAMIESDAADFSPDDNVSTIRQVIGISYDPNNKTENHGGVITTAEVLKAEYLQYTIFFQNTGTDTAFKVKIKDTLDSKLDWSTLRMITSSHNYQLTISDQRNCEWAFQNINLVDSNTNEPQSHGYLTYIIKPKTTLAIGDTIKNRASIYFDNNAAILTNIENTVVTDKALPLKLLTFTATRDNKNNLLQWTTSNEINVDHFIVERSTNGREFATIGNVKASSTFGGTNNYSYTDNNPTITPNSQPQTIYYRLKMVDKDGQYSYSPVRMISNNIGFSITVYPNPTKDRLHLQTFSSKKTTLQMQIISQDGKVFITSQASVQQGSSTQSINIRTLPGGSYFLKVASADNEESLVKFEKI